MFGPPLLLAQGIGASLVLAAYKEDDRVRCASPIFRLITY
jgi:hypothetical protein